METVETLYDFIRSHPFPERWLDEKEAMYRADLPAGETQWGKNHIDYAQSAVDYMAALTQNSLSVMEDDEKYPRRIARPFLEDLSSWRSCGTESYPRIGTASLPGVQAFGFAKLKALRGYRDDPLKLRIAGSRDTVKSVFKKLASLFQEDRGKMLRAGYPQAGACCEWNYSARLSGLSQRLDGEKAAEAFGGFWGFGALGAAALVRQTEEGWRRTEDARLWRKASTR